MIVYISMYEALYYDCITLLYVPRVLTCADYVFHAMAKDAFLRDA